MSNNLVWNVYKKEYNSNSIEIFNVFDHIDFYNALVKLKKKAKGIYDNNFKEQIKQELFYYFNSKCEYELLLNYFFNKINQKIDIYDQVMLNFSAFCDYLISNIKYLK